MSLASTGFFEECRFFRVLKGFVAQFGINGDPTVQAKYRTAGIKDDPVKVSNKRGTVVFATSGKDSRTTQVCLRVVRARIGEGEGVRRGAEGEGGESGRARELDHLSMEPSEIPAVTSTRKRELGGTMQGALSLAL